MAVSKTVKQTVNAMLSTYKKEIQKSAGDSILSAAEQRKLGSNFAKSHLTELRGQGKPVTVAKAVAFLKPILTRAAESIAGSDGRIDAQDVKKLRVPELRTRAATLFETGPAPTTVPITKLKTAVAATDVKLINEMGKSFEILNFSASETPGSIVAKLTENDIADITPLSDYATVRNGAGAVTSFATNITAEGKDFAENSDTPSESRAITTAYKGVTDAATEFLKSDDIAKTVYVRHEIQEDGDTHYDIILAQRKSGAWVALKYVDFPF